MPTQSEWELPVPFHDFNLPQFPSSEFPAWIRAFVEAEASATQTPRELAAMLALSVLAAACAKKVVVEVKPRYCEPVNLFIVVALPPGNRKSAVFTSVAKPLETYERREALRTAGDVARRQTAYKIKEANLRKLHEQAASATDKRREVFEHQACDLAAELDATVVGVPTRCLVDDCTPEKLPGLLRDHGGRIAAMSPEGDLFDLMAGRYSTNKSANFGVYLRGHAGDTLRVDRVGRPPEYVSAPALTIGLAVQPEVIRGLAEKPGFRGRGLLGRFLYALPESLLGHRDTNPPPVPPEVRAAYHDGVTALLSIPFEATDSGESTAHILTLDQEARDRHMEFEQWVEPQLDEFGDHGGMTDWGGKIAGAVVRIAGLLHMADHAGPSADWKTPITSSTMDRAVRIGKCLIPHAKAGYAEMGADEKGVRGEILLIIADYGMGIAPDSGSQHVAIFRMVCHCRLKALVPGDFGVFESAAHRDQAALSLLVRVAELPQGGTRFPKDIG